MAQGQRLHGFTANMAAGANRGSPFVPHSHSFLISVDIIAQSRSSNAVMLQDKRALKMKRYGRNTEGILVRMAVHRVGFASLILRASPSPTISNLTFDSQIRREKAWKNSSHDAGFTSS